MNDPEQPSWGSWAGRYGRIEEHENQDGDQDRDRHYYWANLADAWQGTTHRDNTLGRWAAHLQNDFRARLDWCVKDFAAANHPPVARVKGELHRSVKPGDKIVLDASESTDADAHGLKSEWIHYAEPGSYRGPELAIDRARSLEASLIAPQVDATQTLHIILIVTDEGSPPLTRYQRLIVTVQSAASPFDERH